MRRGDVGRNGTRLFSQLFRLPRTIRERNRRAESSAKTVANYQSVPALFQPSAQIGLELPTFLRSMLRVTQLLPTEYNFTLSLS